MSLLPVGSVSVGDVLPSMEVQLSRLDLVRYAGASLDANPIHWNERVATSVGLDGVIAHGMLTMALGARLVTTWCGDPGAIVDYGVVFTSPLLVPDDDAGVVVALSGKVTKLDSPRREVTVALTVTSGGRKILGRSIAVVRLA